jgi:two-component system nitrogen regulation sensor histidine kinase NtrY
MSVSSTTHTPTSSAFERFALPRNHKRWVQRLIWLTTISLLVLLAVAFAHISGGQVDEVNPRYVLLLALSTLVLLLMLGVLVVRDAWRLYRQTKQGVIGTRLQKRILTMFCVVSIIPTLIVALFSILFFNVGVKNWFDEQVTDSMEASATVAQAYLEEHKNAIRYDAQVMANEIREQLPILRSSPALFEQLLTQQTSIRGLTEAIVFEREQIVARTALSFSLIFERLPEKVLKRADEQRVVVMSQNDDKIQGIIRLNHMPDIYLLISRTVDPRVINHMKAARETMSQYQILQRDMVGMQAQFSTAFAMLALLLLLVSTWAGMRLAVRIIGPIAQLNRATERVRAGDYSSKVPEGRSDDEISNLARTFNRMTGQLEKQRKALLEANEELDDKRRFSETVLAGVSAGVFALTPDRSITLHNRRALELLKRDNTPLVGVMIADILPEIEECFSEIAQRKTREASKTTVVQTEQSSITLFVRVTAEQEGEQLEGYIVTFDDISALVQAQRSAAWADVARRIAHEIKNPLTPITLSTERLKKKFAEEITSDREAYLRYLETISRHVRDIGSMVEEFVNFARMPAPIFREELLAPLVRKIVFSEQTVHPNIRYEMGDISDLAVLRCDERQVGQALLNLIKNAAEAFENITDGRAKVIRISVEQDADATRIVVQDSGNGFPPDKISTLTEPYVTTREKGTGLGLAIVKKTMEEHFGSVQLANHPEGGALVTLRFPHRKHSA